MTKFQVRIVLEILGRPASTVDEALRAIVARIGAENGVTIKEKNFYEAKKVPKSKELYTAFAEVELELNSLNLLFGLMFAYLPSHVEILEPEKLNLTNVDLSEACTMIVQRMHYYDAVTKGAIRERDRVLEILKDAAPRAYERYKKEQEEIKKAAKKGKEEGKKEKKARGKRKK
ncbi:hypothetical protein D6817_00970 [Candidatus Pacearchaeota archaeon]|nr:MAG: hypothetical protein D6817_00970 [Candidatus Pacearchaeota archaeon]